jgi:hypothetical protein
VAVTVIRAAAGAAGAACVLLALLVLLMFVLLVLVAVLVFAWAGWLLARKPATARRDTMAKAITTHADFVHLRTIVLFLPEDQRRTLLARRRGHVPGGRKRIKPG